MYQNQCIYIFVYINLIVIAIKKNELFKTVNTTFGN